MEPFGSAARSCRSGPHFGRAAAIEKEHSWSIDQPWPPPAAPDARALRPLPRPARVNSAMMRQLPRRSSTSQPPAAALRCQGRCRCAPDQQISHTCLMANSAPGKEEREINAAEAVPLATPSQTDQAHIHIQTVIAYSRCRTRLTPYLGCP
jgi:hypothetical protein